MLHWCALLDLDQEAVVLLKLGANAAESNRNNQWPFELAQNIALAKILKNDIPLGKCPNCAKVMPLVSNTCNKCNALFGSDMCWSLIPVNT